MPKRFLAALCCALLAGSAAASAHAQCTVDPALSTATINTPATLFVCPAGDGATLASVGAAILVHVHDAVSGGPCTVYTHQPFEVDGDPPSDILDGFHPPGIQFDVPAAGFQNLGGGDYLLEGALIAGGVAAGAIVKVAGVAVAGSPLPLRLTSPDLNADGMINISDIGIFAGAMGGYDWRLDYNGDGLVNISDIGIFVAHLGHTFPPNFTVDPVD
jgi:hypothetical protein